MTSCERPSNSAARLRGPSAVWNADSFSMRTQGRSWWRRVNWSPLLVCSFSSESSSSGAAFHSSIVTILWSGILSLLASLSLCRSSQLHESGDTEGDECKADRYAHDGSGLDEFLRHHETCQIASRSGS